MDRMFVGRLPTRKRRDIRVGGEGGWGIPFLTGRRPVDGAKS